MSNNTTGMGGSGTGGGNTIPWSDPNYWSGWNNTVGSLGGAVGSWIDAFSNNGQQPINYQSQPPVQNNTPIYIGMGILAVILLAIIVILLRKK